MKKAMTLFLVFAFMFLASTLTYAADFSYDSAKYDQADVGDRDVYELVTKGLLIAFSNSDNQVVVNNDLIGKTEQEVITQLGLPNYIKDNLFYYISKDEYARFPVVVLKFNKVHRLKYIYFPINDESVLRYLSRTTVQGFFGPIKKKDIMRYSDENKRSVVFTWSGIFDKTFTGVVFGELSTWEPLKLPGIRFRASNKMMEYRMGVMQQALSRTAKELDDKMKEWRS